MDGTSSDDNAVASERKVLRTVISRRAFLLVAAQAVTVLGACTASPTPGATPSPDAEASPAFQEATAIHPPTATAEMPSVPVVACPQSLPMVVPPTPLPYPGYTGVEPETGLHVTGEAQRVDLSSYRLKVSGLVQHPVELTYDDLRCLPKVGAKVKLECPGFFVDQSNLAGSSLASLVALAKPQEGAKTATLVGADGHTIGVSPADMWVEENFLAYEWEGELLPPSHGFPVRAVFPGTYGSNWIKWLLEIKFS